MDLGRENSCTSFQEGESLVSEPLSSEVTPRLLHDPVGPGAVPRRCQAAVILVLGGRIDTQ